MPCEEREKSEYDSRFAARARFFRISDFFKKEKRETGLALKKTFKFLIAGLSISARKSRSLFSYH